MKNRDVAKLTENYVAHTYARYPIALVRGKGARVWDADGKEYLDFLAGIAVNSLGHCHPAIVRAIQQQACKLIHVSNLYHILPQSELARELCRHSFADRVFFCNSGAEANEGLFKLARKFGHNEERYEIITALDSFHGRTLATMAASGKPGWDTLFQPKVPGFPKVPLGDLEAVRKAVTPETVAVMLEPIQGEAGVFVAADDWLRDLRKLTRDLGILLILDEIQTGIGRTGRMYGYEHAGIEPDIVTLGKGLGGGTPIAALVASAGASVFEYGDQGGTFNGNALMAAVGCAVVTAVGAPGFLDSVVTSGRYLTERLGALSAELGQGEVRGRGLLVALQLQGRDAPKVARAALDRGLLINAPRPDTLRFMPSLTVSRGEIDEMLERLRLSLSAT